MKNRVYLADWANSGWEGVKNDFSGGVPDHEPRFVFAYYLYEDYSGSATVITSNGRTFQIVEGSHCSCFGLEGQWSPTQHSLRELRWMMGAQYGFFREHRADLEAWLIQIKRTLSMAALDKKRKQELV